MARSGQRREVSWSRGVGSRKTSQAHSGGVPWQVLTCTRAGMNRSNQGDEELLATRLKSALPSCSPCRS
jgi:hypothetical protein